MSCKTNRIQLVTTIVFLGSGFTVFIYYRVYSHVQIKVWVISPTVPIEQTQTSTIPPRVNISESKILYNFNISKQILNVPLWVAEMNWNMLGDIELAPIIFNAGSESQDKEQEIAWNEFFYGTTNGLVLELGAMNGKLYSGSSGLERYAGWKSILIEASSDALEIPTNRPNSLSLQLAVCESETMLHFVDAKDVGGILEFMSPKFVKTFHAHFLRNYHPFQFMDNELDNGQYDDTSEIDWERVEQATNVIKQLCVPLQTVFNYFNISHINFLILDLEGGELSALKSIDFDKIEFDVLCVETNRFYDIQDPYIDEVAQFMAHKGYIMYMRILGRNSWFLSANFKKISKNIDYELNRELYDVFEV